MTSVVASTPGGGVEQLPGHLDCVGPGWHPILKRLHEQLLTVCPAYRVGQVKEKFGALRVYLVDEPPEVCDLLDVAEAESTRVCEVCGAPGVARMLGWVKTLCDGCAA